MDKTDNNQPTPSTGESSTANVQSGTSVDSAASSTALGNPGFLQNVQQRLDSMGEDTESFLVGNLQPEVIRRVNALRNIQFEHHKIEASFFEEVHALECQYLTKYQPLYEKRLNIIKGIYEPTDAEAKCAFDENLNDEETKKTTETDEQKKDEEKVVGVPEFWLQVFKNSDVLSEMIREQDEVVLKHLQDVRITMQNQPEYKGFTIEFEFTPNEYFTNKTLTKSYELRTGPDEEEPLSYEGPEIIKSTGCEIQWNKGKNVTVKMVKKRQKHKNRGTIRVVTKEVKTDSFFNFFTPPTVPEEIDPEAEDSDEMRSIAADYEIGHMLRDSIVPKAVLYFTGEVGDDDGEYDEDEEDEDDDDEDDDDDDQEEDEDEGHGHHHHGGCRGGHHHGGGGKHGSSGGAGGGKSRGGKHGPSSGANTGGQQPECKQQ